MDFRGFHKISEKITENHRISQKIHEISQKVMKIATWKSKKIIKNPSKNHKKSTKCDFDVGVSVSGAMYIVYVPYIMIVGTGMNFKIHFK